MVEDYKENYFTGWIKLFRSITKHWLWPKNKPLTKLEAWLLILLEVNHDDEKFIIGYDILECPRGDKLYSLETWSKLFNWNKSKVRRFFSLLEKDSMIELKSEIKTTRLTVCNYCVYQGERNGSETEVKRKRNGSETEVTPIKELKNNKELKNDKNISWKNNFEIYKSELRKAYNELIENPDYISQQEKYHPNVDIKLSIEKACVNFWATEAGWKHKIKQRSKEINWKQTLTNAIDLNKVYKGDRKLDQKGMNEIFDKIINGEQ